MKLLSACLVCCLCFGCSGSRWSTSDWESIEPSISAATEFAARTAFQNTNVQPFVPAICEAMPYVLEALSELPDADTTFDTVKQSAIKAIRQAIPEGEIRDAAEVIVNQVLSIAFLYTRDKYIDLIEEDQSRVIIMVSRGISNGITNACNDLDLTSFEIQRA